MYSDTLDVCAICGNVENLWLSSWSNYKNNHLVNCKVMKLDGISFPPKYQIQVLSWQNNHANVLNTKYFIFQFVKLITVYDYQCFLNVSKEVFRQILWKPKNFVKICLMFLGQSLLQCLLGPPGYSSWSINTS